MFCRTCGAKLPENVRFCAECGAPAVESEIDQPTMIKPRAEARGRSLVPPPAGESPAAAQPPAAAPPPSAPPAQPVPPTRPAAPSQPKAPQSQVAPPGYDAAGYGAGYGAGGPGAGGPGQYGAPQPPRVSPPRKNDRRALWIGLTVTAVVIIAAVVAVWLLVIDKDDVAGTTTTEVVQSTTTTARQTTTSSATSTTASTAPSTTVTLPPGAPGDSPGEWVEVDTGRVPSGVDSVAVSDQALLISAGRGDGYARYAYLFESKELIELPINGPDFGAVDIDGLVAVWWEGTYDEATATYSDEYIYSYRLPNGPKVRIAGGDRSVHYPQIAGEWVTWAQGEQWEQNPEEYFFVRIFGVTIDEAGNPRGAPVELVPAATSFALGDSVWTYSLSETHLTWDNAARVDIFDPGVYVMDLTSITPEIVKAEVWRPSTSRGTIVYTDDGLVTADLESGKRTALDPLGDFASAAPTYAAYYRPGGDGYDIVARGYTGTYEQTLGTQANPPWLSPLIAVSPGHVAFAVDGKVRLFEWRGPRAP